MTDQSHVDRPDATRLSKLRALRDKGVNPYPSGFQTDGSIAEIADDPRRWKQSFDEHDPEGWLEARDKFNNDPERAPVAVAGRVIARRDFGKGIFLRIQDRSERLQLLVGKRNLPEECTEESGQSFAFLKKELDIGDFIGVRGPLFWTRTGELTVQASYALLLSKSLRPLPEKWHGLQDVETRYRQRYVDLIANSSTREVFRKRTAAVRALREFLEARDFLEVETPMLHPIAGGAAARPFVTYHNALSMEFYMRIAPELYLKRLVVGGFERVFEINRNFRNEGLSRRHNPEFTMLEFYQAYATYEDLMTLTEEMLIHVVKVVNGGAPLLYEGREIAMDRPWKRLALRESLVEVGGLSPQDVGSTGALRAILEKTDVSLTGKEPLGKLQALVFEEKVEDQLWNPTFIQDFPVEVSPLARRNDRDPSIVERFELFVAGREIANAFSELNDPEDQKQRFREQVEAKAAGDEEATDYDADYIRALQYGLPPTAGEGIGVDRLVMLLVDAPSIRDVILFPHSRPESG